MMIHLCLRVWGGVVQGKRCMRGVHARLLLLLVVVMVLRHWLRQRRRRRGKGGVRATVMRMVVPVVLVLLLLLHLHVLMELLLLLLLLHVMQMVHVLVIHLLLEVVLVLTIQVVGRGVLLRLRLRRHMFILLPLSFHAHNRASGTRHTALLSPCACPSHYGRTPSPHLHNRSRSGRSHHHRGSRGRRITRRSLDAALCPLCRRRRRGAYCRRRSPRPR